MAESLEIQLARLDERWQATLGFQAETNRRLDETNRRFDRMEQRLDDSASEDKSSRRLLVGTITAAGVAGLFAVAGAIITLVGSGGA